MSTCAYAGATVNATVNVAPAVSRRRILMTPCAPWNPNLGIMRPRLADDELFPVDTRTRRRSRSGRAAGDSYVRFSEIEVDAELHEARVQDQQRLSEGRVAGILREHGVVVEHVVEVDVESGPGSREPENLADAEIQ